jgi:hypothetical protein
MKIIRKLFRVIFFIFLISLTGGIILTYLYKEKIINFLVNELNNQLTTKIDVEEIKFSVIRKFPDASLEFRNILIWSTSDFPLEEFNQLNIDTLLNVKHLFLQFNIKDIFKNDFKIKTIQADDGIIRLFTTKTGLVNYKFWKTKQDTGLSNFNLQLHDLKFSDIDMIVVDRANKIDITGYINELSLRGNFSSEKYSLKTQGGIFFKNISIRNSKLIQNNPVKLELNLDVENNEHNINKGLLDISGLRFDVRGTFFTRKDKQLNLEIKGKDLDIYDLVCLLPEGKRNILRMYNPRGNVSFQSVITGMYGPGGSVHIEANFGILHGIINRKDSKISLSDLDLEGYYSNGENNNPQSSSLEITKFNTSIGGSNLTGSYRVNNFDNPSVELLVTGEIQMEEIKEFFNIDTLQYISGKVRCNFKLEGKINNLRNIKIRDLEQLNPVGHIVFKDVGFKLKDARLDFSDINGNLMLGKHFWLDGISVNVSGNELYLEGKLGNAMPYLISGSKPLLIEGKINADKMDFEKFIRKYADDSKKKYQTRIKFPDKLQAKLDFNIGHFSFRKFSCNNFKGLLTYRSPMAVINSLSLETMEGKISGNGLIIQELKENFTVKTHSYLSGVNIRDLFSSFNSFGQEFIMDNHIKGKFNGNISFSSEITPDLKIKKDKVIAKSHFTISNGELIDFEPILGLSRFIDVSELGHIVFSTIENEIYIKDETITIPLMDIYSSAFNISLSGVHNFNNDFTYKARVLLSELLARKARNAKEENKEFGIIEDDGLGKTSLYLSVVGEDGDIKISYDKDRVKTRIKDSMTEERNTLRKILKEEFGWFKEDSIDWKSEEAQQLFLIEWEEADTIREKRTEGEKTPKKFIIEWEEETDTNKVKNKRY